MNIVDELKITDGVYDEDIYDNIEVDDDSEELLEPPMLNNDSDDSPLESLSKEARPKKGKNYYDDEYVTNLIKLYQDSIVWGKDEEGNKIIVTSDRKIEREIMANVLLVVRAIINKYAYWRFLNVDDLTAEGLKACWMYLPKFDTSKGTTFNLFSLICKRHFLNLTACKEKKYRLTADIDIHPEVEAKQYYDHLFFIEQVETEFIRIINENYLREQRKQYLELTAILVEYLVENAGVVVGKLDLISAFRRYGYKSSQYKAFITEMSKYKTSFYELAN